LARRLGAKEAWIAAVRRESPEHVSATPATLDGVEESWQAAIRYAEHVTESGHSVSETLYRSLAEYWDEGQLVEITLVVGLFAYFNRFNDALQVEVTR
jgi:alkylhydroperoxidase family enzyme